MSGRTPRIMDLAFSNHARLDRTSYLLEYRGVRFKLVQERGWKWADHLLTILPEYSQHARQHAFQIGQELVNLLSWKLDSPMQLSEAGTRSCDEGTRLSLVRPSIRTFPEIPFQGHFVNNSPSIIPAVDTEQQRLALGLFREARASNNHYLAFLFFWHVVESGNEDGKDVIDRLNASGALNWVKSDITRLSLQNHTLGEHLKENVRHAIAHIRRWSGRRALELSNLEQRNEMSCAARIIHRTAKAYMERDLLIGKQQLYLLRKGRNGFPKYTNHTLEEEPWMWRDAYPRKFPSFS